MTVLDRHAWWLPRWLDRILPNIDIEGAALEKHPTADSTSRPSERVGTRS
ncbi:MAG: putative integral rane protein [Frankiales bacterium]|nr:putative integral rane protein [Frankiales bacterium]